MAYYLVKAKIQSTLQAELRSRLDSGEIQVMRPFGQALQYSLDHARTDPHGWTVWEEEDYCSPPLKEERRAVLDKYFDEIQVEEVSEGEGWRQITELPELFPDLLED